MTLLVQKEVADRIVARDGKESILSLSVKVYGTPKREFLVPRGAFKPAPNVDSAVLTIKNISRKNFSSREKEQLFFTLIHAGFAHKRKLVQSNLKELVSEKSLRTAGVCENARAEDLSLKQWLMLAR
jgi:16S rRNA (adenine1518-N6/adenine1519-N6)-dimethyltransferase